MSSIRAFALTAPLFLASLAVSQNEVLYYKFDGNGGNKVINYAPATSPAPEEGTIRTTDTTSWTSPGKFGIAALRGGGTGGRSIYNNVDTGWDGAFTGSYSVAWFMKNRNPSTALQYIFDDGNFRGFTNGVAGTGIWVRAWGGTPADLKLTTDVQAASATKWLHVALVVDATALLATFYVDGVPQTPIPITGVANVPPATTRFIVNSSSASSSSFYDLDEFRFYNRAATAAEVLLWATVNEAADSVYGQGCKGVLTSTGGKPTVGNATYALALTGPASAGFALGLGSNRSMLGSVPLPFDLGTVVPALKGCNWETSSEVWLAGSTNASGNATFGLPIPPDPSLNGIALFTQAFFAASGPTFASSNPFAISIGL